MWGLDQAIANSARQAEEISRAFEEQRKAERQHRERLEEGVTSSIEQKKLIEEQVGILYEQNRLLSENYDVCWNPAQWGNTLRNLSGAANRSTGSV